MRGWILLLTFVAQICNVVTAQATYPRGDFSDKEQYFSRNLLQACENSGYSYEIDFTVPVKLNYNNIIADVVSIDIVSFPGFPGIKNFSCQGGSCYYGPGTDAKIYLNGNTAPGSNGKYFVEINVLADLIYQGTAYNQVQLKLPYNFLVEVRESPSAYFQLQHACTGEPVQFINLAQGNINNWSWDFGDNGATSTDPSPQHTFSSSGSYLVRMIVDDGCKDTFDIPVSVFDPPSVHVEGDDVVCIGGTAHLTAVTTDGVSFQWNPSHGLANAAAEVAVKPTENTTYTVTTWSAVGCISEASFTVSIDRDCDVTGIGIFTEKAGEFLLYPNPVTDFLSIKTDKRSNLYSFDIVSIHGQRIETFVDFNSTGKIDVRDFAPGIYFLTLKEGVGEEKIYRFTKF